eukprot:gi/632960208/ref/XP_007896064.1/ PREDICTED: transcription factor HES-5-like [Callorhinchus milii]
MAPSARVEYLSRGRCQGPLTAKEKCRLMKPMVEKRRRDRINQSIAQLKQLLGTQLQNERANCKLEKADILESAVTYLQHNPELTADCQTPNPLQDYKAGYSRCLQKTLHFLSLPETRTPGVRNLLQALQGAGEEPHYCTVCPPHSKSCQDSVTHSSQPSVRALWRPWQS